MDSLLSSIRQCSVRPADVVNVEPVRIAVLDSGCDPRNPLMVTKEGCVDPRIKEMRSFIKNTAKDDIQDKSGHGTHVLGLLLNIATHADIYVAKIAHGETLNSDGYDDITRVRPGSLSEQASVLS